jgi:hypothetical protein
MSIFRNRDIVQYFFKLAYDAREFVLLDKLSKINSKTWRCRQEYSKYYKNYWFYANMLKRSEKIRKVELDRIYNLLIYELDILIFPGDINILTQVIPDPTPGGNATYSFLSGSEICETYEKIRNWMKGMHVRPVMNITPDNILIASIIVDDILDDYYHILIEDSPNHWDLYIKFHHYDISLTESMDSNFNLTLIINKIRCIYEFLGEVLGPSGPK